MIIAKSVGFSETQFLHLEHENGHSLSRQVVNFKWSNCERAAGIIKGNISLQGHNVLYENLIFVGRNCLLLSIFVD